MVSTNAYGLKMSERRALWAGHKYTLVHRGILIISRIPPFYTIIKNLSDRETRLPKHTRISQSTKTPSLTGAMGTDYIKAFPFRTPEAITSSKFHPSDGKVTQEASQTLTYLQYIHKMWNRKNLQMSRHIALNAAFSPTIQTWKEGFELSSDYLLYRETAALIFSIHEALHRSSAWKTCDLSTQHQIVRARSRRTLKKSKLIK